MGGLPVMVAVRKGANMFARTSTWSGSPEALQKWADNAVNKVKGLVEGLPGNVGVARRQEMRAMLTGPALDNLAAAVAGACRSGLDADALRATVLPRLRKVVPIDALWWASADPATLLFTRATTYPTRSPVTRSTGQAPSTPRTVRVAPGTHGRPISTG